MDIKGLDKAQVLAALYNAAKSGGMGLLQYDPEPITAEGASKLIGRGDDNKAMFGYDQGALKFDYLKGRVMKIKLHVDDVDTTWYNRDNGEGCAERVIESLRKTGDVNNDLIQRIHAIGMGRGIQETQEHLHEKSEQTEPGVFRVGLGDMVEVLGPKVGAAQEALDRKRSGS